MTTLSILVLKVLARTIGQDKKIKRTQAEKEAARFSLCAGGIPAISSTKLEKQDTKFHVEAQNTQGIKSALNRISNVGGIKKYY